MFLKPYVTCNNQSFQFTRSQASQFAKGIAGDFNPIHDEDNKRFCVPGDLLFAVLLFQEGISQKMSFRFSGMVSDGIELHVAEQGEHESAVVDSQDKEYLRMTHEGDISHDKTLIEHVVKNYVKFSGMNFPHIMVPLMQEAQMMINTARPLVIYESMDVEFERLDIVAPEVEFSGADFDVNGKRGVVTMNFAFTQDGQVVGRGVKRMVATGLRPYDQDAIDALVERFNQCKQAFLDSKAA
ncbi:MAG: DUF3581 domain-containing protein [Vibrio sp.]